jgi:quercetin 2,3-dioxygenase
MKTALRKSDQRGQSDHGWLKSQHTFSFGDYYDKAHMGFRALRVINEDHVAPTRGFGSHPHRDMEIISYVLSGVLEHKDSIGNGSLIRPGEIQRMSAGTGIIHSEFNPSPTDEVHFLQIWLVPARRGVAPSYEQKAVPSEKMATGFALLAGPEGSGAQVTIQADAKLFAAKLSAGMERRFSLHAGHSAFVHVARGSVQVAGHSCLAGDAVAIEDGTEFGILAADETEVLVFDLA